MKYEKPMQVFSCCTYSFFPNKCLGLCQHRLGQSFLGINEVGKENKYIFFGFSHILIQNKPMWRRWSTAAAPIFHSTTKYIVTLFTAVAFCSYDCYGMRSLFFCLEKPCSLLLKSTFSLILLQKTSMLGFLLYRDLFSLPKC